MNAGLISRVFSVSVVFTVVVNANTYNDWAQKHALNLCRTPGPSTAQGPTAPELQRIKQDAITETADSYKNAWSGTKKDLESVVLKAEREYGFEDTKQLGRNATMLVPSSFDEMLKELRCGNPSGWKVEPKDGYHAPNAKRGDGLWTANKNSGKGEIIKYTNSEGGEVVYNLKTGRVVTDEKMGTKNLEPEYKNGLLKMLRHKKVDVDPHNEDKEDGDRFSKDGDQYKYVGILYERDPNDPDKYYIIDGQTGMPMDAKRVEYLPTTLSDMWRDMGLVCVKNDAKDIVPPKDPRLAGFDPSGLKRAEGCNACKCKQETANLKPQIWQNGLDDGYSIVVLCAKCMAVKYSLNVADKKEKQKICTCSSPDVFFAGVCRKKIGVLDKLWAQHYCRKCGGFRRGDMFDIIKTDKGFGVYPAGVIPSDWDGKVYESEELDAHVRSLVK